MRHPDEVAKWNHDSADMFEMGTVYTIVAGLLNLLVICDAFGGPLVILPPEEKKKQPDDEDEQIGEEADMIAASVDMILTWQSSLCDCSACWPRWIRCGSGSRCRSSSA